MAWGLTRSDVVLSRWNAYRAVMYAIEDLSWDVQEKWK